MKKWKKRLLWTLAVLLLLPVVAVVGLRIAAGVIYPWPDPVPGVRLEPLREPFTPEQAEPGTAWACWKKLEPLPKLEYGEYGTQNGEMREFAACGWQAARYPVLERRLSECGPNFKLMAEASRLPGECRELSVEWWRIYNQSGFWLAAIEAERCAAAGDWDGCLAMLRGYSRIGLLMAGDMGVSQFYATVRRLALDGHPSVSWLRALLAELDRHENCLTPADWAECMRRGRQDAIAMMDRIRENPRWMVQNTCCGGFLIIPAGISGLPAKEKMEKEKKFLVDGNDSWSKKELFTIRITHLLFGCSRTRTMRHLDAVFSSILSCENMDYAAGASALQSMRDKIQCRHDLPAFLNDPLGQRIRGGVWEHGVAPRHSFTAMFQRRANLRATRLVLALRLYQIEHDGRLPAKLEELVAANCLDKLPDDPFAPPGTPFGYRANPEGSFVVWSRGENMKDDGGKEKLDLFFPSTEPQDRRNEWRKRYSAAGKSAAKPTTPK